MMQAQQMAQTPRSLNLFQGPARKTPSSQDLSSGSRADFPKNWITGSSPAVTKLNDILYSLQVKINFSQWYTIFISTANLNKIYLLSASNNNLSEEYVDKKTNHLNKSYLQQIFRNAPNKTTDTQTNGIEMTNRKTNLSLIFSYSSLFFACLYLLE